MISPMGITVVQLLRTEYEVDHSLTVYKKVLMLYVKVPSTNN